MLRRLIQGPMSVSGDEPVTTFVQFLRMCAEVVIAPKRKPLLNDGQEIAMIAPKRRPVPESESNARPTDPLMKECSTCHKKLPLLDHFDPRTSVCRACEQKAIQHAMQVPVLQKYHASMKAFREVAAESEDSSSDVTICVNHKVFFIRMATIRSV